MRVRYGAGNMRAAKASHTRPAASAGHTEANGVALDQEVARPVAHMDHRARLGRELDQAPCWMYCR